MSNRPNYHVLLVFLSIGLVAELIFKTSGLRIVIILLLIYVLFAPLFLEPIHAEGDCFPTPGNVVIDAQHLTRAWFAYATPDQLIIHRCDSQIEQIYLTPHITDLLFDSQIGLDTLLYMGLDTGQRGQLDVITGVFHWYAVPPDPDDEGGVHDSIPSQFRILSDDEAAQLGLIISNNKPFRLEE